MESIVSTNEPLDLGARWALLIVIVVAATIGAFLVADLWSHDFSSTPASLDAALLAANGSLTAFCAYAAATAARDLWLDFTGFNSEPADRRRNA